VYEVIAEPQEQTEQAPQDFRDDPAQCPVDTSTEQQPEGERDEADAGALPLDDVRGGRRRRQEERPEAAAVDEPRRRRRRDAVLVPAEPGRRCSAVAMNGPGLSPQLERGSVEH